MNLHKMNLLAEQIELLELELLEQQEAIIVAEDETMSENCTAVYRRIRYELLNAYRQFYKATISKDTPNN